MKKTIYVAVILAGLGVAGYLASRQESGPLVDHNVPGATTGAGKPSLKD